MLRPQFLLRTAARTAAPRVTRRSQQYLFKAALSTTPRFLKDQDSNDNDNTEQPITPDDPIYHATTAGEPGATGEHEGQYARTDDSITVEYPEEQDLPRGKPILGRGGPHYKRTLASFSLEGKTAIVTGGARGLGLVMAQALAESGAEVALVDLNSMSYSMGSWRHRRANIGHRGGRSTKRR
jgi:D-arabinitol 2-dehydrogenase